ncbi:MAG TPA: M28 family peptidase [Candidatus Angelobacter sp.]|nr:M28 family peptidase [Candidatus Angelobacter sp.]
MYKLICLALLLSASFMVAQSTKSATSPMPPVPKVAALPPGGEQAMAAINADNIRWHVKFLADDLLEGRGTGQRGGDIAAEYIATQFALYGLKPAGDNGSYMQKVPMLGIVTLPESTYSLIPSKGASIDLRAKEDIVAMDETGNPSTTIDAPIVWIGYGIDAPEFNWNDYRDVDVKGKVLLMLVNEPPSDDPKVFGGKALTYYGRWTYKYEEAARMGAVGVLLIHKTDMASYGWDVVRNSWSGERSYLRDDPAPKLKMASWIQLDVARKLMQDCGLDLEAQMATAAKSGFKAQPLNAKFKAHIVSKVRPFDVNNVVAALPGSDPKLNEQGVMYSAHYDHLGIVPGMPGDNIYNGAQDNATGVGILLEMARVFSEAKTPPERTLYFVSVTAEEQGLRGSEYYGKHPSVPAKRLSLDLNFDDVPPLGVPQELTVSGAERTTFYPTVESTAKAFGLAIMPDSNPGAGHYYRSDHFSLARVGVPAFSIGPGVLYQGHDRQWGLQKMKDFVTNDYHHPSDEYHPEMDFAADGVMARFGVALGWQAANQAEEVGWQKGDEFEKARTAGGAQ